MYHWSSKLFALATATAVIMYVIWRAPDGPDRPRTNDAQSVHVLAIGAFFYLKSRLESYMLSPFIINSLKKIGLNLSFGFECLLDLRGAFVQRGFDQLCAPVFDQIFMFMRL
jgi:hypothetical protein